MFPFPMSGPPGPTSAILKPQDVFATSAFTGTGANQIITNGVDLLGRGGLVWGKSRSVANEHLLADTVRGGNKVIASNSTAAEYTFSVLTALSNGYQTGSASGSWNAPGESIASWSFARAAKFFDIVTWTGDGTSNRQIPHALGVVPGMVIVKRRDAVATWHVFHRSLSSPTNRLILNATDPETNNSGVSFVATDASSITIGSGAAVNASGATYVAYLFAHDPSADGIVQCGSFTTDANGVASVTLPWRPQLLLVKPTSTTGNWTIVDTVRGWRPQVSGGDAYLYPNLSNAEVSNGEAGEPTDTGFAIANFITSASHIYLAIRAPY